MSPVTLHPDEMINSTRAARELPRLLNELEKGKRWFILRNNRLSGVLIGLTEYEIAMRPAPTLSKAHAYWELLSGIIEVEAVMARCEGNRHRLWTVVDRVDDATRDAIYWQEWALMERYPDVDFDFHILERRGRPLDTL